MRQDSRSGNLSLAKTFSIENLMPYSPLSDLQARGLVNQVSDADALDAHLGQEMRTLYCGFDPTAASLHIGNLSPLLVLRRFQLAGHRPIVLIGGATGLIGDPSGKIGERRLHDRDLVASWSAKIRAQTMRFLDFDKGACQALLVNNQDWTQQIDLITFLRDFGKHFSVNAMLQKDSIRQRIANQESGISYTEFSYVVLQSLDYLELAKQYGCSLQIGGSDQWGNITMGVDLVRRILKRRVFALTLPLITKADGGKLGKTESGDVPWLDAQKTSPYKFYQYWLNLSDADVVSMLGYFTMLPRARREEIAAEQATRPECRPGQKILAQELTKLAHGEDALHSAERIGAALFSGDPWKLGEDDLVQLAKDGLPSMVIPAPEKRVSTVLIELGLAKNTAAVKDAARRGSILANAVKIPDLSTDFTALQPLYGRYVLLRFGKNGWGMALLSYR